MLSLSYNNQADVIEAFYYSSIYPDDLRNIDTPYFEQKVLSCQPRVTVTSCLFTKLSGTYDR